MRKEKQIEEMAKALTAYEKKLCERLPKDKCLLTSAVHAQVSCDYCKIAEFLVNAGYLYHNITGEELAFDFANLVVLDFSNGFCGDSYFKNLILHFTVFNHRNDV